MENIKELNVGATSNDLRKVQTMTKKLYVLTPAHHDMIKPNEANRVVGVNDPHVQKLVESMKKDGFNPLRPIIVGPDMVIRAGHNRYVAAKIAKVTIFVEVDENEKKTLLDQSHQDDIQKKWTTKDWIRTYAKVEGKQDYLDLKQIIRGYFNCPIKVIIASCACIGNQANGGVFKAIKTGKFQFQKGKNRMDVEHELDEIARLNELIPDENRMRGDAISMHVGLAYLWLKMQKGFDKSWFDKNVIRNRILLVPQSGGSKANRKMLLDIYNKNLRRGRLSYKE